MSSAAHILKIKLSKEDVPHVIAEQKQALERMQHLKYLQQTGGDMTGQVTFPPAEPRFSTNRSGGINGMYWVKAGDEVSYTRIAYDNSTESLKRARGGFAHAIPPLPTDEGTEMLMREALQALVDTDMSMDM
jgi:hypothetical protein